MKLRWKALIAVGTAFAGVLLISQIILYYPMINNILAIEQSESLKQAHRVADMIAHELANLNATTVDYAAWDDTYEFVQNGNPEYITNNILDEIFINLRLNLILFTNTSKQVVYGKAFDLENSTETAFPQSLLQHLAENDALLTHENETSTITGIINLPEGPLLVASSAITTSLRQGPVQGALITGRFLDTVEISRLYELVHLPIVVQAIGDSWVSTDFQKANSSLSREQPYFSNPLDDKNVAGYALINDVYGNPALILRVTMPRDIYAQGITNITYNAVALFVVGVTFCVVSIAYLEKSVLSRLSRLQTEVEKIEKSGDLKAQVSLGGKDELAELAHKINEMLSAIQKAEQSLRESETRLRQITENMFDMVSMIDTTGICIYASPSITKTLGYKPADLLGKPLISFVHLDDLNRLNEAFRKALENKSLPKIECRYKHLDGHYLWLEVVGNIIY
ncbi:MAG: CHASE4 domain-containing protein, partial [Candidatus Bathyarchaeia archaeon]